MALESLLSTLCEEIHDPEEENFLLFSQPTPPQNLGFVNTKATTLDITVAGRDLIITQSPGLLSSNRKGGTTGAVVWKITPLFAQWIASDGCFLFWKGVLGNMSTVLELGCGISGILAVVLGPKVGRFIATDQEYVFKLLKGNIVENTPRPKDVKEPKKQSKGSGANESMSSNIDVVALDWESNSVSNLQAMLIGGSNGEPQAIDAVIACDCIYNEVLIEPFVRTCAETCQLSYVSSSGKPTVCIIAQQLRSDIVFEAWLSAFHKVFRVWRVPDGLVSEELRGGSGFVVHIGILR